MTVGSVLSLNAAPTERGLRVTDSVDAIIFILVIITHCLLGRIMEMFAIANPSRASLAGVELLARGHRVEVGCVIPHLIRSSQYPESLINRVVKLYLDRIHNSNNSKSVKIPLLFILSYHLLTIS